MSWQILEGDVRARLRDLADESIQTCVTSPPYWGLRDYGTAEWEGGDPACEHAGQVLRTAPAGTEKQASNHGAVAVASGDCGCGARRVDSQLGLEPTPELYVEHMVQVFREVRRVLRPDGTLWLNLGDSYNSGPTGANPGGFQGAAMDRDEDYRQAQARSRIKGRELHGLKPKDLVGIPWMVAFALRADGWYLRADVIWAKPNPMPESVRDRPTKAHEYLFLLTKSPRYYYDADAIREEHQTDEAVERVAAGEAKRDEQGELTRTTPIGRICGYGEGGRNKRSVWTVPTTPYAEAHFATYPPALIEPCILAGAPEKACGECGAPWQRIVERTPAMLVGAESKTIGWGPTCDHGQGGGSSVVLDPFAGSGTTGVVALRRNRAFVGIELSPAYAEMARNRIRDDAPLLNTGLEAEDDLAEPRCDGEQQELEAA